MFKMAAANAYSKVFKSTDSRSQNANIYDKLILQTEEYLTKVCLLNGFTKGMTMEKMSMVFHFDLGSF